MRTRSTFSVLFWINTSRMKNSQGKIYARITLNGKRVNLSLKHTINCFDWDAKRSRVKGRGIEAVEINEYLQHVRSELYQCYRDLITEKQPVSLELLKSRFLGEDIDQKTFKDLFEYHNFHNKHSLNQATLSHYKTSQKYLLEYLHKDYNLKDISLEKLDYNFVTGFETFLRAYRPKNHPQVMSNNGAMKHIQRFRKMIRIAINLGWISKNPLSGFKIKMVKKERDFLNSKELRAIENFVSPIERLEIVKDLFIFSCYTGIAYCDIMALTKDQLVTGNDNRPWIVTRRLKTNNAVKLPLLTSALKIIEKYENHHRKQEGKLLPRLSNQKLNSYLKELADHCKIKKHLTFHMARHTFATTVTLTNGVPIETVSKILGHTRLATTQIYARVLDKKIGEDMEILRKKLEND